MRLLATAFALLSLGLLSGCNAGASHVTAAETANKPQIAAPAHNYKLYGSPEKGEFMIDSATGQVWELKVEGQKKAFEAVPVNKAPKPLFAHNKSGNEIVSYDNGNTWIDAKTGEPVA